MSSPVATSPRARALALFAWSSLVFLLAVILWGAYVRATGSGAGCGAHWPLCNGEVIPRAPAVATLIELTHRVTSGLAFLGAAVLAVWTFRVHPRGHPMRRGAVWSFLFMIAEALIGAGLVLFELVAENPSMARAYAMSAHLVNTFLLLGAWTLTCGWASGDAPPRLRSHRGLSALFLAAALGLGLAGISGAIAALGDTLFPARTLAEALAQDISPTAHVLLRLRVLHPFLAILGGALALLAAWTARALRPSAGQRRWAVALTALVIVQLVVGAVNVVLLAPVWMQLVHLLLADLVWIALVRTGALTFGASEALEGGARLQSSPARAEPAV